MIARIVRGLSKRGASFREAALLYLCNHVASRIPSSAFRLLWYRRVMGYDIAPGASILPNVRFSERHNLRIGAHTVINNECRLDNRGGIVIGENVSVSYGALILTGGHDIESATFAATVGLVRIEDYVWICARAIIQPGCVVGRGAVVLAGSVVTSDVPPMEVVGGVPAVPVKQRNCRLDYRLRWDPAVPPLG